MLTDSPKHGKEKQGSAVNLPQSANEAQLRYENDRLKLALAQRYVHIYYGTYKVDINNQVMYMFL